MGVRGNVAVSKLLSVAQVSAKLQCARSTVRRLVADGEVEGGTHPPDSQDTRTAIQLLSSAEQRCVYTHTGWREIDHRWVYLHSGGAIDSGGAVAAVNVRLRGQMSRYELRLSTSAEALMRAVKASLNLLELGETAISFPLLAASYRAVFGQADFAVHLAGETGAFESEIAALFQQHFGAAMDRLNLPGSWSSTGNALEALGFVGKDALIVIDDFAPQGLGLSSQSSA
jgi:hypothetical protein